MSEAAKDFWKGLFTVDKMIYLVGLLVALGVTLHSTSDSLDTVKDKLAGISAQVQAFNSRTEAVEKDNIRITTKLDTLEKENDARAKEWKLFRELIGQQDTQIAVMKDRADRGARRE